MSRLRVPDQDGAHLIVPSLAQADAWLADGPLSLGQPRWQALRELARENLLQQARAYLALAGEPLPDSSSPLLILSGHQPELFHPGVWLKNFVLARLARRHHAIGINLLVDNDAVKSTSLMLPQVEVPLPSAGSRRPHVQPMPLDRQAPGLPYEEWKVRDEDFFSRLPERIAASEGLGWMGHDTFLGPFWEESRRRAAFHANAPERLAAARRSFERRWGHHNLEVPIRLLSQTPAFHLFTLELLSDLPRLHQVFNEAVGAYRRRYGLRSRHHPFPDLVREGDWYESPFWIWPRGGSHRQRLFVQRVPEGFLLRAGQEPGPLIAVPRSRDNAALPYSDDFKIRPRALTTTLFARLLVADLFIHGIGGGRYDEVTDEVIRRYFGLEPPPCLIVSGTLRLPLPTYPVLAENLRGLARQLRELDFNPQRFLRDRPEAGALLQERREWVGRQPTDHQGRRQRFRELRRLNEELGAWLVEPRRSLEETLRQTRDQLRANALLRRRDWAFCLYPIEPLRRFLTAERDSGNR